MDLDHHIPELSPYSDDPYNTNFHTGTTPVAANTVTQATVTTPNLAVSLIYALRDAREALDSFTQSI